MSESDLERGEWKRSGTTGPTLAYAARRAKSPRAAVAIIPGYADYSQRYARTMDVWAEHGLSSVAIDLRGHGRSGGPPGHVMRFDEYLDDVRELLSILDAKAPAIPRLVFGHSFGAVVAIKTVLAGIGSFRAMALSDPYLGLALDVPRIKIVAGQIASRFVPALGLPSGLTGAQMSTSAEAARAYDSDPLIFKNARARWFTETTAAQERAFADASRLTMPLYVTFGTADPVASMPAAKKFFDAAGSADKTWDPREGLYHEVLNEPSWKDIVEAIARWVLAKV